MSERHEQRYKRVIARLAEPRGKERALRTWIRSAKELGYEVDSSFAGEAIKIDRLTKHKLGIRQATS